jgi:hypothetical protein
MDVIYPGSPLYIYQAPELAYNLLISTLEYANNATNVSYNLAWCPHHLGKYPVGYILPVRSSFPTAPLQNRAR